MKEFRYISLFEEITVSFSFIEQGTKRGFVHRKESRRNKRNVFHVCLKVDIQCQMLFTIHMNLIDFFSKYICLVSESSQEHLTNESKGRILVENALDAFIVN